MDIIAWVVGLVIMVGLFDEGGFIIWFFALIFYLSAGSNDETTKQDPEISKVEATLVERVSDTGGSNNIAQENATGEVTGVYRTDIDAQNESDTGRKKIGVSSSGEIATKIAIMKECSKNRKFVFVHEGIEYDIGCGTAFTRKLQD